MQKRNRHGPQTSVICRLQSHTGFQKIDRRYNSTVRIQTFRNFRHRFIKQCRAFDFQVKQLGPVLIANLEQIAEPLGDQQQHVLTFTFEQCVRGNSCAHLHGLDRTRRRGVCSHDIFNAMNCRIHIPFWVLRQQLVRDNIAIWRLSHNVCKRATPVDPEFPLFSCHNGP